MNVCHEKSKQTGVRYVHYVSHDGVGFVPGCHTTDSYTLWYYLNFWKNEHFASKLSFCNFYKVYMPYKHVESEYNYYLQSMC